MNKLPSLPATFETQVQTVNEQITTLDTSTASLEAENELIHDQINDLERRKRANARKIIRNGKEADKLRRKREIASAAARAILEVDQP